MKKIISNILIIFFCLSFIRNESYGYDDSDYFIVTAYYSPLINQKHYSYSIYTKRERTYEEEKRLQGKGIRGASGKAVFSGMLAGPKNYKFGTKIFLEGLGIGEIADRGGAIVNKGVRGHSFDRIDVWMGYGDEGLQRATNWGKRKIKGYFVDKNEAVTINYKDLSSFKGFKYINKGSKKNINIFDKKISSKIEIQKMQEVFQKLGFYKGKIDGLMKSTITSIYDFQISKKIVKSEYSLGAGSYGPKTRKALKKEYNLFLKKEREKRLELLRIQKKKEERIKIEKIGLIKAKNTVDFIGKPKMGEISHGVRELQKTLHQLGYFNNKDTAIYGKITQKSLISYQLDKKIINSSDDLGAGIVGPKTRESLIKDLKESFVIEKMKKENEIKI